MKMRLQKWGDSLALRIPQDLVLEAQLEQDDVVDILLVDGKLVVSPVSKSAVTLEQLLEGITEQNLHGEVDTGPATGNEVW